MTLYNIVGPVHNYRCGSIWCTAVIYTTSRCLDTIDVVTPFWNDGYTQCHYIVYTLCRSGRSIHVHTHDCEVSIAHRTAIVIIAACIIFMLILLYIYIANWQYTKAS